MALNVRESHLAASAAALSGDGCLPVGRSNRLGCRASCAQHDEAIVRLPAVMLKYVPRPEED